MASINGISIANPRYKNGYENMNHFGFGMTYICGSGGFKAKIYMDDRLIGTIETPRKLKGKNMCSRKLILNLIDDNDKEEYMRRVFAYINDTTSLSKVCADLIQFEDVAHSLFLRHLTDLWLLSKNYAICAKNFDFSSTCAIQYTKHYFGGLPTPIYYYCIDSLTTLHYSIGDVIGERFEKQIYNGVQNFDFDSVIIYKDSGKFNVVTPLYDKVNYNIPEMQYMCNLSKILDNLDHPGIWVNL